MGMLFILENAQGHICTVFPFAAGFGDFAAALVATASMGLLLAGETPGDLMLCILVAFENLDFLLAYSLSFISTEGLAPNVLAVDEDQLLKRLLVALPPVSLVPLAMACHTTMLVTSRAKS